MSPVSAYGELRPVISQVPLYALAKHSATAASSRARRMGAWQADGGVSEREQKQDDGQRIAQSEASHSLPGERTAAQRANGGRANQRDRED